MAVTEQQRAEPTVGTPAGTEVGLTDSQASYYRKQGDALVRVPRSEVQSVELERGKVLSQLKLTFADGSIWRFEIPRANRKGATEFTEALGGTVS